MYQIHNLTEPPPKLLDYLESLQTGKTSQIRRRAVLTRSTQSEWILVSCVVEAFPDSKVQETPSRVYMRSILFEDWLTPHKCRRFVEEVHRGEITIADSVFRRDGNSNWRMELLPANNEYMSRSGIVAGTRFGESHGGNDLEPLVAMDQPYYPDLHEAVRDWLPMKKYHGSNDGRRGEVLFILPEARAYFSDAEHEAGILTVHIDGDQSSTLPLTIKGAYWEEGRIKHFEAPVIERKATFIVPDGTERLEYLLLEGGGFILDFQREDRFRPNGLRRRGQSNIVRDKVQEIERARSSGEGQKVEFKPFVRLGDGMGTKDSPSKLREVVATVVAYANSDGGQIFLGIKDDCDVSGFCRELQAWAKAPPDEVAAERYRGSLLAAIKDNIDGEVGVSLEPINYGDEIVVIISVEKTPQWPAQVKADGRLFVRVGPNNKQVPANQWAQYRPHLSTTGPGPQLSMDGISAS